MRRLDPDTWKRLAPLLDQALELPHVERASFVERVLGDEPELREILEELIEAEQRAGGLLDTSAVGLADSFSHESVPTSEPLPRIDGYSGFEEIGRGGMGVVYRAIRHGEGFEQEVAVKVVRHGLDQTALRLRFERERWILARLEHPGIARLVDGGTTVDGQSYFAMEYVEGATITRHADERRLSLQERLLLFEEVCAAVSFAQQRLVVHRDLKPSNILVDTAGRVRLLDFGIARLIDPEEASTDAGLTRDGSRLLTPEYAAPEQLRGEPPSTATDVYALGVILFELLSGRHPHGDTRAGSIEVAMGLRESEWLPRAVDTERRVVRADGTVEVITGRMVAQARRLTTRALRRALGGDLATITAKALQTESQRRYSSAEALLADVVRQREAQRAQRAYDFLAGLFQDAHPDAARGTDWSASQLLERGAERLADAWPDDPEARASLQQDIASILTDRGDYDAAARMLREALSREEAVARNELLLALSRVELYRGRSGTADSLLAVIDAGDAPLDSDERLRYLQSAASIHYGRGAYAEAESLIRLVMDFTLAEHGDDSKAFAEDLNNLATFQLRQARFEEAERNYLRALEIFEGARPRPLSSIALAHHNLGDLYQTTQRYEESMEQFRRAIELRRELHPDGHDRLAESLRGLAAGHRHLDELEVADSLLTEAASMIATSLGTESEVYARSLNALAVLAYQRDDLDTARERFVRANTIFESILGPTHPTTLTVTNNVATVQSMTGRTEEAVATFRLVLERRREVLGDQHPDVAFSYNSIGQALRRLDRPEQAIPVHREALQRYLDIHGPEHPTVAFTRSQLGSALRDAGRLDEAIEQLRLALDHRGRILPPAHRDIADTRLALGIALTDAERWAEAEQVLLTAENEIERTLGGESTWLASARAARGLCLARQGQAQAGRSLAASACEVLREHYGGKDSRTRRALRYRDRIADE